MPRRHAAAKKSAALEPPTPEAVKDWTLQCIGFYANFSWEKIKPDWDLEGAELGLEWPNLVDLAGTLRHGVQNFHPDRTLLAEELEGASVAATIDVVTQRILS
jgi:hypothetical protein